MHISDFNFRSRCEQAVQKIWYQASRQGSVNAAFKGSVITVTFCDLNYRNTLWLLITQTRSGFEGKVETQIQHWGKLKMDPLNLSTGESRIQTNRAWLTKYENAVKIIGLWAAELISDHMNTWVSSDWHLRLLSTGSLGPSLNSKKFQFQK